MMEHPYDTLVDSTISPDNNIRMGDLVELKNGIRLYATAVSSKLVELSAYTSNAVVGSNDYVVVMRVGIDHVSKVHNS